MTKTWQGKRTDFLLILLYSLVTFFIGIIILLVGVSPVWIYFRKVPKKLQLDLTNRKLEIKKRRKTLCYNMDYIRFYQRQTIFFFIFEIHATFETARNGSVEKLATVLIVPNWGLSWNKKVMTEIIHELKQAGVPEIKNRKAIPLSDYFHD
ncbi:hypothetical protein [Fluviicola sp.]|uniref:hypothetical protein n=1 Tax=Fluviicola sp. TaxID=1917219 RepID=UPI00261BB652|nr:hypothetical protein [Fluviicola sp.]